MRYTVRTMLQPEPPKSQRVNFRLSADEVSKLAELAAHYGTTTSEIIRAAIRQEHAAITTLGRR
jgi:uncharacterized protein (DUF1778 family)